MGTGCIGAAFESAGFPAPAADGSAAVCWPVWLLVWEFCASAALAAEALPSLFAEDGEVGVSETLVELSAALLAGSEDLGAVVESFWVAAAAERSGRLGRSAPLGNAARGLDAGATMVVWAPLVVVEALESCAVGGAAFSKAGEEDAAAGG